MILFVVSIILIIVAAVLEAVKALLKHFRPVSEKSKALTTMQVIIILTGAIGATIGAHQTFIKDPFSKEVGSLKPRYTSPQDHEMLPSATIGQTVEWIPGLSQAYRFDISEGEIIQPLGENVPFSIRKTKEGLAVSAIMMDLDGEMAVEIRDNKWKVRPDKCWAMNFDRSALEVVDGKRVPVLQIEYLDDHTILFGGVFRGEHDPVSVLYPDFPFVPKQQNTRGLVAAKGRRIIICGYNGMHIWSAPWDLESLKNDVKKCITPWFKYPPECKKPGIRNKSAVETLRDNAEGGDAIAMNKLGLLYFEGKRIKRDHTKAAKWFRKSVELGNTDAMINLARIYEKGVLVPKDYEGARELYEKAAVGGEAIAMNSLGNLLYAAEHYNEAAQWEIAPR
jgi:hypothetical protein